MPQTFTVFIDPIYNASERQAIGREVVNFIRARTRRGQGIGGVPFRSKDGTTQYSKAYQEHRDFGIAGKSKAPINLTFTGDMLASLEVLDFSLAGQVVVGIDDPQNEEKVVWMREKGYNFLGLSAEEKNQILARFQKLTPTEIAAANIAESVAEEVLRRIVSG